jgi:hypothetical protein
MGKYRKIKEKKRGGMPQEPSWPSYLMPTLVWVSGSRCLSVSNSRKGVSPSVSVNGPKITNLGEMGKYRELKGKIGRGCPKNPHEHHI